MSAVVVDASVWIAAQDSADPFNERSRMFFNHAAVAGTVVHVPAFARVEVACALARRLRDAERGERLANLLLEAAGANEQPISSTLLTRSLKLGTADFLRGAYAIYAATAEILGCALVSWDKEHLQRAGAVTPGNWMVANPLE